MNMLLLQLGSALLYGLAGFCLFLTFFNRFFILLPDGKSKPPAILAGLLLVAGGPAALGFFAWRPPWIFIPLAVVVLALADQVRRILVRRACVASGPLHTTPHRVPWSSPVTTTDLANHRYEVTLPGWRGRPLRVAHISDLHVDASQPLDYYRKALAAAEQARPDLAVFTGDFITRRSALPKLKEVLRPIARTATLAVLGNHDYWTDPEAVRAALAEGGLRTLSNETMTLDIDGQTVAVTGYDHPWVKTDRRDPPRPDAGLWLALSHTPDNIYRIACWPADVVFSGHCHAGQVRLPILGPLIVPSVYGRRFDHGHFIVHRTHLFVAGGVGAVHLPFRIYCQPDIFIVDILPETQQFTTDCG